LDRDECLAELDTLSAAQRGDDATNLRPERIACERRSRTALEAHDFTALPNSSSRFNLKTRAFAWASM
jgi:hypothetical protein